MKTKTVFVIGAILFCAILHDAVVTLVVLIALLIPVVIKVLKLSHEAESGEYRKYND